MSELNGKPRVAAYLRVSTDRQDETMQREVIEQWLSVREVESVKWYVDHGKSGTTLSRPAFEEMQRAIFHKEVDTIVMYSLDRFARAMIAGLTEIHRWDEEKLTMVFIRDHLTLEPDNPIGKVCMKIMVALTLALAEGEHERIIQRAKDRYAKQLNMQRHVKNMAATGMSPVRIAKQERLPLDRIKRMIAVKPPNIWFAGAQGFRKQSIQKAYDLHYAGLNKSEIGRVLGLDRGTVARYIKEVLRKRAERHANLHANTQTLPGLSEDCQTGGSGTTPGDP